jgi:hypothetical protein
MVREVLTISKAAAAAAAVVKPDLLHLLSMAEKAEMAHHLPLADHP